MMILKRQANKHLHEWFKSHRRLSSLHRRYLYIGGMPEAVSIFKDNGSLSEAADVHREIIDTYIDDFAKSIFEFNWSVSQ